MYARELAYYLGVSESTVSRLLSGDRKPSLDMIINIRRVLEWSVEDQAWTIERHPDSYGDRLRIKMEDTRVVVDSRSQTVRSVRRTG